MCNTDFPFVDVPLTPPAPETGFESSSVKVWKLYESEADKHDTELAATWKGETDAMLIFVREFSTAQTHKSETSLIDDSPIDGSVFCCRFGLPHRDIQDPSAGHRWRNGSASHSAGRPIAIKCPLCLVG
jgi:Family of unknown function (DUF6535)